MILLVMFLAAVLCIRCRSDSCCMNVDTGNAMQTYRNRAGLVPEKDQVHDMPCFATSRPSSLPREGRRWSRCVEHYCTHSSTEMGASMVSANERCTAGAEYCFLKRFIVKEETQPMHPSRLPHSEAISPPKQRKHSNRLFFGR